jgi:hypothetical protein
MLWLIAITNRPFGDSCFVAVDHYPAFLGVQLYSYNDD